MSIQNTMNIIRLPVFFRKVTENIKISLAIIKAFSMIRNCRESINGNVYFNRLQTIKRKYSDSITVNAAVSRFEIIIRKCLLTVNASMKFNNLSLYLRNFTESISITMNKYEMRTLLRKCVDNLVINSVIKKFQHFIRINFERIFGFDVWSFQVLFIRSVPDTIIVTHFSRKWGAFIRGLRVNAHSIAETSHTGEFYRFNKDTVQTAGAVLRSLSLFVRIISKIVFRDYLIGRFLRAREELKLKSPICREINLESKID